MKTVVEACALTVRHGPTEVLKDISFMLEQGDFVGLAGPNGAGKTTLVKALLGLVPVASGRITLFGMPQRSFRAWDRIGYLPQKISSVNPLFPATVAEVVFLGLLAKKKPPKAFSRTDRQAVEEILVELGMADLKNKLLSELSGGEQQKVMLARALVSKPELLFFDEPSTALDPDARDSFFGLVRELNAKKGSTIVFITHDTGSIGRYATKLMYLDKKIVYFGNFADFCKSDTMTAYFGARDQHIICHQHG